MIGFLTVLVFIAHFTAETSALGELSVEEKKQMLDQHNYFRDSLPNQDRNGKTFAETGLYAVDMKLMLWDHVLEQSAQDFAAACIKRHDMVENNHTWGVRMAKQSYYIGQNLYGKSKWNSIKNVTLPVRKWYQEVRFYSWDDWTCDTGGDSSLTCGHFTEMMWDYTEFMGCAREHCLTKKGKKWTNIVCHYSPMGNVRGQNPFSTAYSRVGCSDPERQLNCQFKNLCAKNESPKERKIRCGERSGGNGHLSSVLGGDDVCNSTSSRFYKAFEAYPAVCGMCERTEERPCSDMQKDHERCAEEKEKGRCETSNQIKFIDCPVECGSCEAYDLMEANNRGRSLNEFNVTIGTLVYNDEGIHPGELDEHNQCPQWYLDEQRALEREVVEEEIIGIVEEEILEIVEEPLLKSSNNEMLLMSGNNNNHFNGPPMSAKQEVDGPRDFPDFIFEEDDDGSDKLAINAFILILISLVKFAI